MTGARRTLYRQVMPLGLIAWLAFGAGEIQGTPLLGSLECYNDYKTYVACTYKESVLARNFLKMNLNLWANYTNTGDWQNETCNVMESRLNVSSHIEWTCWRRQGIFALSVPEIYVFHPDRDLSTSIQISLLQNIQPLPPLKPRISKLETRDFLLRWETPYDMNDRYLTAGKMQYEVNYKRVWELWEMSSSVSVSNVSQYILSNSVLIPGSTYVARIRAKPLEEDSEFWGHWSDWSTEVSWEVQEEDEAKPKNLHCIFNGIDKLTCHWEVRKEVTDSISFTLFYKENLSAKEKECHPHHQKQVPGIPFILSSCNIKVTDLSTLSQYLITVKPELKTKIIAPCMNIQPRPPENLTVVKTDADEYLLSWMSHKLGFVDIPQQYQVCYWKVEEKQKDTKELSPGCQQINITTGTKELFLNLKSQLEPETRYAVKVRAHSQIGNPNSCYNGPWSEWSEEYQWQTDLEILAQDLLLLSLIPVGIILLFICAPFGYRYLKRAKRNWEDTIPNPGKSKLFITYLQRGYLMIPQLLGGSDLFKPSLLEKEDLCSCPLVLEGKENNDSDMAVEGKKCEIPHLATQEMEQMCQPFPSLEHRQGTPRITEPTDNPDFKSSPKTKLSIQGAISSQSSEHNAFTALAYSGPYLLCPQACTLNTFHSELTLAKTREELAQRLTGYTILPLCVTENPPPLLDDSQFGTCPLPPSLGYVVNPSEAFINSTPSTMAEDHQTAEAPVDGAFQAGNISTENLTPENTQTNLQTLQCSMGYVMAPPPGQEQFIPLLSLESTEPQKSLSAQMSSDILSSSSKNECNGQRLPPFIDFGECGAEAPPKLLESYVEISPALANTLTIPQLGVPTNVQELGVSKDSGERLDDNIIMFVPDNKSPVLLQQVGDYCFFPGSKLNDQTLNSHCPEEGRNMDAPIIQQESKDKTRKPKGSPESNEAGVEEIPHMHTIHLMKRLKNDYFMFPQI